MIPFDMTVSFLAGQTLAYAARKRLRRETDVFANRPLVISLLWMVLIYTPSAMFFFHGWSAWNSVYLLKDVPIEARFPEYTYFETPRLLYESILIWLDCTVLCGLFYGAFVVAHRWILAEKAKTILWACGGVAAALIVYMLATYDRSFIVTTYEAWNRLSGEGIAFSDVLTWKGREGSAFLGHSVFWCNLVIAFIDFGPLAYLYVRFSRWS